MMHKEILIIVSLSTAMCAAPTSGVFNHNTTRRFERMDIVRGSGAGSKIVQSGNVAPTKHLVIDFGNDIARYTLNAGMKVVSKWIEFFKPIDDSPTNRNNDNEGTRLQDEIDQHDKLVQKSVDQHLKKYQDDLDKVLATVSHLGEQSLGQNSSVLQSS